MKINASTALATSDILLVPYCKSHVSTYHEWMKDPNLQAATASEPLSLDEEYAMQQNWRSDRDKLTFIVCLPLASHSRTDGSIKVGEDDSSSRMIGDINLFLVTADSSESPEDHGEEASTDIPLLVGEIEIMIALKALHRRGYGRSALKVFMTCIILHWREIYAEYHSQQAPHSQDGLVGLAYLRVKIDQGNEGSIRLFESTGFRRTSGDPNYFGEVELRWREDGRAALDSVVDGLGSRGVDGSRAMFEVLQYEEHL